MKIHLSLMLSAFVLLGQSGPGWASTTTTFTISATVPAATGVTISVGSVNRVSHTLAAMSTGATVLSFDPMTYNTTYNIYLPATYFTLNFGVTGGSGTADLTLTYTEGTNPNGSGHGLGYKTVATFAKEVVNSDGSTTETIVSQGKMRLIDLNGTHIPYTEFVGGYPRVYLGVWSGSTAAPADPANGEPFSNADAPGAYSGTLVITSVVN